MKNSLVLLGITPLSHVAQRVSLAPPHNTLPAFINLNGSSYQSSKSSRTQLLQKKVGSPKKRKSYLPVCEINWKLAVTIFWKNFQNWILQMIRLILMSDSGGGYEIFLFSVERALQIFQFSVFCNFRLGWKSENPDCNPTKCALCHRTAFWCNKSNFWTKV